MISAIAASTSSTLFQNAKAQTGNTIPTYAFINVSPNPCGVGQTVTVNFWLAVPIADSELAKNMTVVVTAPDGTKTTLGPFTSDLTGGTNTYYTPTQVGNYTFQFFYGGQTLVWRPERVRRQHIYKLYRIAKPECSNHAYSDKHPSNRASIYSTTNPILGNSS